MKLSASFSPKIVDKVNIKLMEEWLMSLSDESKGYVHYYTMRKRHIQEGQVAGITQQEYWMNCGRMAELRYMNALSSRLIKKK